MASPRGRGRLSAIDLLPDECSVLISWAAQELAGRDRTQLDIYAEFKTKLIALQGETGVGFDIPSFSAFNRHSLRLSQMTRRLEQTRDGGIFLPHPFRRARQPDFRQAGADR